MDEYHNKKIKNEIRRMESLIRLICKSDHSQSIQNEIANLLDLTRLNNTQLVRISDVSKLTAEEFESIIIIDTDEKIIALLKKLIEHPTHPITLEDLKSLEFNRFSDVVLQSCVGRMLESNIQSDLICVVLDQMKSVNYGKYAGGYCRDFEINPLIHCCYDNKFDLVKLLVERYGADIEYRSASGKNSIMISSTQGNVEITKYLYDLGAQLQIKTTTIVRDIKDCASEPIMDMITKWEQQRTSSCKEMKLENDKIKSENDKIKSDYQTLKSECEQIKADYMKLKLENDEMKQNYQTIST